MPDIIKLKCRKCEKALKVPLKYAGKVVGCPACKQKLRVPEPVLEAALLEEDDLEVVEAPSKRRASKKRKRKPAPAPEPAGMNAAEWIAGVLLFAVGPLIVVFWALQRNPKWKPMLALTVCMWAVGGGVLYSKYDDIVDYIAGAPAFEEPEEGAGDEYVYNEPPVGRPIERGSNATQNNKAYNDMVEELKKKMEQRRAAAEANMKPPTESELADMAPIPQRAYRANVGIRVGMGSGSGVICKIDGSNALIITNRHVVDPEFDGPDSVEINPKELSALTVAYVDGSSHQGQVVWVAPTPVDLAIIRAKCPESKIAAADLSPGRAKTHEEIFTVGNPVGLGWTYTEGKISAIRDQLQGDRTVPIYQIDATINRGNSGGGLYNQSGQLIGINTAIIDPQYAQRLGFAIRVELLRELKPSVLKL